MEYEFDIVGDMDLKHNLIISKTRCKALDGQVIALPGEELGKTILDWLASGEPETPATTQTVTEVTESMNDLGFGQVIALPGGEELGKTILDWLASDDDKPPPHWIDDLETDKKFWLWAVNQSLSDKDVYAALGVRAVNLYSGTKADAMAAINTYIAGKVGDGEPETLADVKARLQAATHSKQWSGKPTDAQRGLLIGQLTDILGSDEACKLFLAWLFDYPTQDFSRTMLSGPEVVAVLDELEPEKQEGGKYVATNDGAVEAFQLMLRQARIDSGQTEMPL